VCIALCTIAAHNIVQNRPENFPPYPPDNHHCSDDVYLREGGNLQLNHTFKIQTTNETEPLALDHILSHNSQPNPTTLVYWWLKITRCQSTSDWSAIGTTGTKTYITVLHQLWAVHNLRFPLSCLQKIPGLFHDPHNIFSRLSHSPAMFKYIDDW